MGHTFPVGVLGIVFPVGEITLATTNITGLQKHCYW
jgi:hypothetical protein